MKILLILVNRAIERLRTRVNGHTIDRTWMVVVASSSDREAQAECRTEFMIADAMM